MSEVNWDLAPEGAEELVQYMARITWRKGIKIWCAVSESWCDYVSDYKTIATRPQQKTAADAYDYYKGNPPFDDDFVLGIAWSNNRILPYCKGSPLANGTNSTCSYIICTREQFEAYAKEQEAKTEDEKWTHYYMGNEYCKIVVETPDKFGVIVVDCEDNGYMTCELSDLKPIKPKLTEDAMKAVEHFAYSLMEKESYSLEAEVKSFRDNHEIIQL